MSAPAYKTPEYYHCLDDRRLRDSVYEPEADTFLFLDALDAERDRLQALGPRRCVEVGCGSGSVITHLFSVLNGERKESMPPSHGPTYCAVDVNPVALEATAMTWRNTLLKYFGHLLVRGEDETGQHLVTFESCPPPGSIGGAPSDAETGHSPSPAQAAAASSSHTLHLYHGDLFHPVPLPQPDGSDGFDVVLFNPPYVPTSLEELQAAVEQKDVITAAWCGGPKGRVVLDRFLDMLPRYLSPKGVCYVVLIRENDEAEVVALVEQIFRQHHGLPLVASTTHGDGEEATLASPERLMEVMPVLRRYTGEHLSIHRIAYRQRSPA